MSVVEKLHKPLGVCSVCQKLTNLHEDLNHRCHGRFNGRPCYGTYKSGVSALWDECERGLTAEVELRLTQEVARLGGRWAHVLNERIDTKRDVVANETWLHGRYTYVLYR